MDIFLRISGKIFRRFYVIFVSRPNARKQVPTLTSFPCYLWTKFKVFLFWLCYKTNGQRFSVARESSRTRLSSRATLSLRNDGGMSLWNGMWHGLRNDIIMRNVKYGKWRKEISEKYTRVLSIFSAPIWVSNCFAGPFITAKDNKAKQKVAISFTAFVSI